MLLDLSTKTAVPPTLPPGFRLPTIGYPLALNLPTALRSPTPYPMLPYIPYHYTPPKPKVNPKYPCLPYGLPTGTLPANFCETIKNLKTNGPKITIPKSIPKPVQKKEEPKPVTPSDAEIEEWMLKLLIDGPKDSFTEGNQLEMRRLEEAKYNETLTDAL